MPLWYAQGMSNDAGGPPSTFILDGLRIQVLSESLLRIEERGPAGYEDRPTFQILERRWGGAATTRAGTQDRTELAARSFRVVIAGLHPTLESVRVHAPDGALLFDGARPAPSRAFLPAPGDAVASWAFADQPRLIPPPWGALPPPDDSNPLSGWVRDNPARDVYVFMPGPGGYRQLLADFIRLTGRIPLPPLCALGLIDSRYHPYTQDEALQTIDEYIRLQIPLDLFVLDTDWRVGASHGYGINTSLLPDLAGFVAAAHARNVRVMLNDHPEPVDPSPLSPRELRYRAEGLTSLLRLGVDYWWFDRNWHVTLGEPAPGLSKEVWGMRLYHDIAQAHRPAERALVLSNVEGIDNGRLNAPPSPASHRFPIWWTGDTRASWSDLQRGVRNAINSGVHSLLPYISEDLGGHHDTPDEELYARFVQYGALSPICRLHCSANLNRHPWRYGIAGELAAEYIRLRYRLLPTLYTAAREAHDTGLPLARRCDLEWPAHPEARDDTQYLFGRDLLVAPLLESVVPLRTVPPQMLTAANGTPGLDAAYFNNMEWSGEPVVRRIESDLSHGWFGKEPATAVDPRHFSVRWTGQLGPVPERGLYRLAIRTDDRVRVSLDGEALIDFADRAGPVYKTADLLLQPGRRYALCIEYRSTGTWHTMCEFLWGRHTRAHAERPVWIPPGSWLDVWSGERVTGPATRRVACPLARVPMWVRGGGLVFSIPPRTSSGEAAWPDVQVDWYAPDAAGATQRELYEDDGHSRGYLDGASRTTTFRAEAGPSGLSLAIDAARGGFPGAHAQRRITLRVHGLESQPSEVLVDGARTASARWTKSPFRLPLASLATRGAADVQPVLELDLGPRPVDTPLVVTLRHAGLQRL